jgi:hypothetical protein
MEENTFYPIDTDPSREDVQFLEDRINEFNFAATGITDGELLAIFVRGDANEIVAGIYGWTWGGTCEIRYLWVDGSRRGQGLGAQPAGAGRARSCAPGLRANCARHPQLPGSRVLSKTGLPNHRHPPELPARPRRVLFTQGVVSHGSAPLFL